MQKSKLQFKIQKYLIVGLGNPGEEYENNRHNIGFLILDKVQDRLRSKNNELGTILLKPDKFMNNSGLRVREKADYYKIEPKDIYIVHDDLDLDFGTVRVSFGSSSAGHNGVQSIIDELKTNKFWRVRVGIGRPPENVPADKFVLQNFLPEEKTKLTRIIDEISGNMLTLLSDPKEKTINIDFRY